MTKATIEKIALENGIDMAGISVRKVGGENRKHDIVDEINEIQGRYDAAMDAARCVDYRLENDELPAPTPEELAELEAKAAAADREIKEQDYDGKILDLLFEYADLNDGEWPRYNDCTYTYMY